MSKVFVTGVVFEDIDDDGLMDLGEGIGGITVTAGSTSTVTNAGGGYAIEVPAGTIAVSATGIGSTSVTVGAHNVGVDFPVGSVPVVRAYEQCQGLEPTMLGTSGDDILTATPGPDVIHGLGGVDMVVGLGADDVICSIEGDAATPAGESLRLAGVDRFATAVEVSQAVYPNGAGVVYLAAGYNFPDALAAGPAAAAEGGPVLLASLDVIPAATRNELVRLDPATVVILGGDTALTSNIDAQLAALLPTATIDRRGGATRYETAVEVSRRAFPNGADTVYVTTGETFPNALSGAPAAVHAGGPLLLVRPDSLPAAVAAELARLAPSRIEVVAGPGLVSDAVLAQLQTIAPAHRVFGPDRYSSAAAASQGAFPDGAGTVYIATGTNYPDALTGGAATAAAHGPILLVQQNSIPAVIAAELTRLSPTRIVILGGPAAVSSAVATQLAGFLP
jgi:putative cell wall-binding protein